jgi:3-oxoadipate enol-lactonase
MRRPAPTFATLPSGVKLHYRIQGEPGAPWLVLINGLLSDTTMWYGVLPGLTAHFRVLTFDSRGQGKSDVPEDGPYTVETMAREAWDMFQVLGIEKPWLLGLSNGSAISLELLSSHPGAFAGAVLTSSMPCIDFTTRLRILHWIQCLDLGGALMQFDAAAPYLWGDRFLEQRHAVLRSFHQIVASGQGHAVSEAAADKELYKGARLQMEGVMDWDSRNRLSRIVDPILILSGAEDLLTPPWKCLATAQGIQHSQFEVVPGIGHSLPVEDPKLYTELVLGFINKTIRRSELHGRAGASKP